MKKLIITLLCLATLAGCGMTSVEETTKPAGQMQLGNPWKSYETLRDAENASSLAFPLPEHIAEGYQAESYRVMNGSLLEVQYRKDESKITVRMQSGEDADISGVYENFTSTETFERSGASVTKKQSAEYLVLLVCMNGHSFSVYIPGDVPESVCDEILAGIC